MLKYPITYLLTHKEVGNNLHSCLTNLLVNSCHQMNVCPIEDHFNQLVRLCLSRLLELPHMREGTFLWVNHYKRDLFHLIFILQFDLTLQCLHRRRQPPGFEHPVRPGRHSSPDLFPFPYPAVANQSNTHRIREL